MGDDVEDKRSQIVGRLTRLMRKDEGWLEIIPDVKDSYRKFMGTIKRLPKRQRERARNGLLLEIATQFVDTALDHGLSYEQMEVDIAQIEKGLNG